MEDKYYLQENIAEPNFKPQRKYNNNCIIIIYNNEN